MNEGISTEVKALLNVLKSHAPSATAQIVCEVMLSYAVQAESSENDLQLLLAGMLVDGISFGNWPWTSGEVFDRALRRPERGVQIGDHNIQTNHFN